MSTTATGCSCAQRARSASGFCPRSRALAHAQQITPLGAVEVLRSETPVDLVRDGQHPRFIS